MKWTIVAAVLLLAGCAQVDPGALPVDGRVHYQLGGAAPLADGVTVVARDRTDPPAAGAYSICYLNGFQTQPQEMDFWLDEHPDLLLRDESGEPFIDPDWPDEVMFDTTAAGNREALADVIGEWIDGCAEDGFQAVEFDNLDTFTRSDGAITMDDNLALATLLVARAHDSGLAAAQKNSGEIGARGRDEVGFDFAVVEECHEFDECGVFAEVWGDGFIDIEYSDTSRYESMCDDPDLPPLAVLRDRDLSPSVDPVFCD